MAKRRDGGEGGVGEVVGCTITFVLLILVGVKYLKSTPDDCEILLHMKFIWLTILFALLASVFGCCGAFIDVCNYVAFFLSIAFLIMFICFVATSRSLVRKGGGEVLPGIAYKEYRLTSYGHKLQNRVSSPKRWERIDKCLHHNKVCKRMIDRKWANLTLQEFYTKRLSSVESGCCKPSNDCNFSYVSPTNWTKSATNSSKYTNQDCDAWNSDPKMLCFNCNSCKAGVVDKFKHNWFKSAWSLIN